MRSADLTGARWFKSTRSGSQGGQCVEVAFLTGDRVAVRDSKDVGDGPALVFTASEWAAFAAGMADGEFTASS